VADHDKLLSILKTIHGVLITAMFLIIVFESF